MPAPSSTSTRRASSALLIGLLVLWIATGPALAQTSTVDKVQPPSWWVDMEVSELQLMVHGDAIGEHDVAVDHEYVRLEDVHTADSDNYLFLDLSIPEDTPPGMVPIEFTGPDGTVTEHMYALEERNRTAAEELRLDPSDTVYLITPDRFANEDPSIDEHEDLQEGVDRSYHLGRHGGDLAGIHEHLDYMDELGVTALWLNPVLINDMSYASYHGYSTTDYYTVDPRFGTNEKYRELSEALDERDMKLIKDIILNHIGSEHWWMDDLPFDDWIHDYPDYQLTNHAMESASDPYRAEADYEPLERGWFVPTMPDLNHSNPFMERYLIQMTQWWVEYADLDGLRIDTYPYNDKEFLQTWIEEVKAAHPDLYIVGESWIETVPHLAYWAGGGVAGEGFDSQLDAVADFPLTAAVHEVFGEGEDLGRLYRLLSKDFLYDEPDLHLTFADNHDMDRIFHVVDQDVDRFELAMAFLLTTRGIPQIYYGTELLMAGSDEHGVIREPMPGGWENDRRDAFTEEGRTDAENEAFNFLRTLLDWRADHDAITDGDMTHFLPENNIYVYGRSAGDDQVVVMLNNNSLPATVELDRYQEVVAECPTGTDVVSGESVTLGDAIEIDAHTPLVIDCER